ncbi:MAG: hypothetical protein ABI972_21715 [Acidobacteriota bacterium]
MRPEELERRCAELKTRMVATHGSAVATVKARAVPAKPSRMVPTPGSKPIRIRQLIVQTRKGAAEVKAGDDHLLQLAREDRLDVTVSRKMLPRALQFLDLMLREFEANGMRIEIVRRGSAWSTVVIASGEPIQVQLREIVRAVERSRPASGTSRARRYNHHPTGRLGFEIGDYAAPRRTWNDGARQRLEKCVDSIVRSLLAAGERLRAARLIREAEEQIRQVEQRHAFARQQAERDEEERITALNRDVDCWHRSASIRAYLGAFRGCMEKWGGPIQSRSEVGRWLAWAENYADRHDPLRPDCK